VFTVRLHVLRCDEVACLWLYDGRFARHRMEYW
jgi:hypothetical protein